MRSGTEASLFHPADAEFTTAPPVGIRVFVATPVSRHSVTDGRIQIEHLRAAGMNKDLNGTSGKIGHRDGSGASGLVMPQIG